MKHKLFCLLILLTALGPRGPRGRPGHLHERWDQRNDRGHDGRSGAPGPRSRSRAPSGACRDHGLPGNYEVSNLIPGQYTVKGSLSGFKTASAANVTVYVGKDTSVRLTLTTGDITETIEVIGGAVDIDTSNTAGHRLQPQLPGLPEPACPASRGQPVLPGPGRRRPAWWAVEPVHLRRLPRSTTSTWRTA